MCIAKLQPCWPTFPCCPFSIPFRICHGLNRWLFINQPNPTQQQNMLLFSQTDSQKSGFKSSYTGKKLFELLWRQQNCSQFIPVWIRGESQILASAAHTYFLSTAVETGGFYVWWQNLTTVSPALSLLAQLIINLLPLSPTTGCLSCLIQALFPL